MEPDKSILRETIYGVEDKPIAWNKAQVWERLQHVDTGGRVHRMWYWAAAAALLLMSSLPAWKPSLVTPAAIGEWSCVEETLPGSPILTAPVPAPRLTVRRPVMPVPPSSADRSLAVMTPMSRDSVSLPPPMVTPVIVTMAYAERHDTLEKIEPVVGVVLVPEKPLAMSKSKRRKLLHTLEPFEKSIGVQDANTIVLARTKQ